MSTLQAFTALTMHATGGIRDRLKISDKGRIRTKHAVAHFSTKFVLHAAAIYRNLIFFAMRLPFCCYQQLFLFFEQASSLSKLAIMSSLCDAEITLLKITQNLLLHCSKYANP